MAEANGAPHCGTLNVIFHGTCAFLLDGSVRSVIPDVENYTIVAGTFLKERPLEKGARYRLKGVNPATGPAARIATGDNIFLVGVSLQPHADVFCELDLPYPTSFRSVRCMDIDKAWFPDPPPALKFSTELALVHVLIYDFDDPASLVLLDKANNRFPWEPQFNRHTRTVNLHVYSDPKTDAIPAVPALTKLVELFGLTVPLDLAAVGQFVSPPIVYPEIRGLEEPQELADYMTSHPGPEQLQPPYHCTQVIATPPGSSTSIGFSVSVQGD
jgi:hypothetical protein